MKRRISLLCEFISSILIFIVNAPLFINSTSAELSLLSPLSLSIESNYSTSNIIVEDSKVSFSNASFPVYIFPIHFNETSNCSPVLSFNTSVSSFLKINSSPFPINKLRLLFLVRWLTDARVNGCVSQEQVAKRINSTILSKINFPSGNNFTKTWIPLIFPDNENNFFKVAHPYFNTGNLRDAIYLDSLRGYNDLMQRAKTTSHPILGYMYREPGAWNEYYHSTSYKWIHWNFVILSSILILTGISQVIYLLYSRRRCFSFKYFRVIHGTHFLLRVNAIIFLLGSAFGLLEKMQSVVVIVLVFVYWILTIWTFSGVYISWSNIAYRVRRRKCYLVLGYIGNATIILTPILCLGLVLGLLTPAAWYFALVSRILFYGCITTSMLVQSVLFVVQSVQLLLHLVEERVDIRVLRHLQRLTYVGIMIIISSVLVMVSVLFYNTSTGLAIEGYQAALIMVNVAGILAQFAVFTLPMRDEMREQEYTSQFTESLYQPYQSSAIMTSIPQGGINSSGAMSSNMSRTIDNTS